MRASLRFTSGVLIVLALCAVVYLWVPDLRTGFRPSPRHKEASALALMFAGASLIALRASKGGGWKEAAKEILLGLAFVLWGTECFLPDGAWATAIDGVVIAIFVGDLGLLIRDGLLRKSP